MRAPHDNPIWLFTVALPVCDEVHAVGGGRAGFQTWPCLRAALTATFPSGWNTAFLRIAMSPGTPKLLG